jgi:hypothetical protein
MFVLVVQPRQGKYIAVSHFDKTSATVFVDTVRDLKKLVSSVVRLRLYCSEVVSAFLEEGLGNNAVCRSE